MSAHHNLVRREVTAHLPDVRWNEQKGARARTAH